MSVGELEKQFKQHISFIDNDYGEIMWRDVLKLLDEAKKEFLKLYPMGFEYIVDAPLDRMSKQVMFEHLEATKKMLFKWFGSKEAEL